MGAREVNTVAQNATTVSGLNQRVGPRKGRSVAHPDLPVARGELQSLEPAGQSFAKAYVNSSLSFPSSNSSARLAATSELWEHLVFLFKLVSVVFKIGFFRDLFQIYSRSTKSI